MKLLYITNQICGPGGLERVLAIRTDYLIQHYKYEIHIITINQNNSETFYHFNTKIHLHNINIESKKVMYLPNLVIGIRKMVKHVAPEIISVCDDGLKGFFVPFYISKKYPLIYERHAPKEILAEGRPKNFINRVKFKMEQIAMEFGAKFYDKFVVLTPQNSFEWNLNNIIVIPNPLPFKANNPSLLNTKRVIAVGRHAHSKGYDLLLEIWSEIAFDFPDWELYIFGKKNPALGLEDMAAGMGLSKSVHFKDPVSNIKEEYQKSSIFVLSSRYEGFGMVLIEAMGQGIPCVSFDCPYGPGDIINNGEDGFLIPLGDRQAFRESLKVLMTQEGVRKEMGKLAFEHVDGYLPDAIVPQWHQLFKSLI